MSQAAPPIIAVEALTRRFGAFTAVDRVSFEVTPGEIFGYLGANGAGKSTTIRMLCGLLAPTEGRAEVAGHDVGRHPRAVKRAIGYMSQRFSLYLDLTVEQNLAFFAGAYGIAGRERERRIAAALEHSGLSGRRGDLTGALPGGIRQRLALASALLHGPRIVFLDEPTAGVDPASRRDFWRIIRGVADGGTTVFVTTHHLDEAEYCARVGLMVDGRLVALDAPDALKRTWVPGTVRALSGVTARQVLPAVEGVAGVVQVQPFGQRVHVRVRGELEAGTGLVDLLRARGVAVAADEVVPATLEDVFLEVVARTGDAGEEAA